MCKTKDQEEYSEELKHKRKKGKKIGTYNRRVVFLRKFTYERRLGTVCVYIRSRVCCYYDYTQVCL